MPRIAYITKRLSEQTRHTIERANIIIEAYQAQGYVLTLRQLYYQFVARDWIENSQKSYKRLGGIISDGRLTGRIDWEAIEDRSRDLVTNPHWSHPSSILESAAASFQLDKWKDQGKRVEVWVEKEALAGVLSRICADLDCPFFACKGYTSQSEMWRAGQRLLGYIHQGAEPVIIHLGDHDPSGLDMTRDIAHRLHLFTGQPVEVNRIALNMDQVQQYNPPPNPAKLTDTRAADYIAEHGHSSWELDALEPTVLVELVREWVTSYLNPRLFTSRQEEERQYKEDLSLISDNWESVADHVEQYREED